MPAGPQALGFVYFAAAKFIGYSAFCHVVIAPKIRVRFDSENSIDQQDFAPKIPSSWKAGAIRTVIGLVIGAIVGIGFWKIPNFSHHDPLDTPYFFLLLVPVRIAEWWVLLKWVYNQFHLNSREYATIIVIGIVTSFVLDAIGIIAAFVIPGGMWVC